MVDRGNLIAWLQEMERGASVEAAAFLWINNPEERRTFIEQFVDWVETGFPHEVVSTGSPQGVARRRLVAQGLLKPHVYADWQRDLHGHFKLPDLPARQVAA